MPSVPDPQTLKRRIGGYVCRGNTAAADETRQQLKAVNAERYIRQLVESAPPLRPEDIERLRALLPPTEDQASGDLNDAA